MTEAITSGVWWRKRRIRRIWRKRKVSSENLINWTKGKHAKNSNWEWGKSFTIFFSSFSFVLSPSLRKKEKRERVSEREREANSFCDSANWGILHVYMMAHWNMVRNIPKHERQCIMKNSEHEKGGEEVKT